MNLKKKKKLIARAFKVGVGRVKLNAEMGEEIKEAITRQDVKGLMKEKIIVLKEKKGKRRKRGRKTKRGEGSKKKRKKTRKQDYVKLTRKLRGYIKNLRRNEKLSDEQYHDLRRKIRAREFRDLSQLIKTIKEI